VTLTDFRDEIPHRAFIDARIIQHALASGHLSTSTNVVSSFYDISGYKLLGPAHAVGLLYCLIVVPRELWWSPELLTRLEALNPLSFFSFSAAPKSVDELFRHLRNALAHADFSISSVGTFTFRARSDRNEPPRFIATIALPQLEKFLSIVGAEMANARRLVG
jgi:hypothetical protein